MNTQKPEPKQLDKFKEAARELQADDDEKHFDEKLKKVARARNEPVGRKDKV